MSDLTKGAILVLLSALFFSTKAIFVKLAYRYGIDTVTLMTLRMLFSLPFYVGVLLWQRKTADYSPLPITLLIQVSLIGIFGYYFASLFDLLGLSYISASFERLILYLYPLVVLLLSAILLKKTIGKIEWIAVVIGYLGIFVIFVNDLESGGENLVRGTLYVLLSAFAFAAFIVGSSVLIPKVGVARFTALAMIAASLTIILHFVLTHDLSELIVSDSVLMLAFAIAIISTVIPSFLMTSGIQRVGANRAALIGAVGPVSTMLMAVVVLGEEISAVMIIGMLMVIAAVTLVSVVRKE